MEGQVHALTQAREDAEWASRVTGPLPVRDSTYQAAQAWALIAIAEQLLQIQMLLRDVTGEGQVFVKQMGRP